MIIGVTGYAQHGKDTVANLLVREFGFTRVAFADTLKRMALVLDPLVPVDELFHNEQGQAGLRDGTMRMAKLIDLYGWEDAKKNPEVRRFLQVLGTEAVRDNLGADSWVNALDMQVSKEGNYVVPDVRFPNEGEYIMSTGTLWGVSRITLDGEPYDNGVGTSHPSEANVAALLAEADVLFTARNVETLESVVRGHLMKERVS
jgi:hypothetical protein